MHTELHNLDFAWLNFCICSGKNSENHFRLFFTDFRSKKEILGSDLWEFLVCRDWWYLQSASGL